MYEDFNQMIEDVQLVIPSTFEECFTYELQILYLKHMIDNIDVGGDYQEQIDNIKKELTTLQGEVNKLNEDIKNLNPDEVQKKLDAMQVEINAVKQSVQAITQNVSTLTEDVNMNTTDIETLTGEMTEVKSTLKNKQNALTFDNTPTAGSQNPVTSDGIKKAIDNIDVGNVQEQLDAIKTEQNEQNTKISDNKTSIDSVKESVANQESDITNLQESVTNNTNEISAVKGSVETLQTSKQDALTFDSTPTAGSQNPVTSDGIKKAIDAGGGGGGTGESQFTEFVFNKSFKVDITRADAIVYEMSSSGIARRTDVEVASIWLGIGSYTVYLPKTGWYTAKIPARVQLNGIGYYDTVIEVELYPSRIEIGGKGAFFTCDINNHMYLVNLKYSNSYNV